MASPRPLSPAPAFPFLASLSLIQLVPKDTVGYGAVPLILVRMWTCIFGVLEGPRQSDCAHLCVSGPLALTCPYGETAGLEMPRDQPSSNVTNKLLRQEPRGSGQNDKKGTWRNSSSETHRHSHGPALLQGAPQW